MSEPGANKLPASAGLDPIAGGDAISGMALLGKTAVSLAVVVGVILLLAWLVRRFNLHQGGSGKHLRVVGSVAVGQRERVVLVEVDKTWLVLGVGGGQVNRLHELPALSTPDDAPDTPRGGSAFAARLAQSLAQRGNRNNANPRAEEPPSDGPRP